MQDYCGIDMVLHPMFQFPLPELPLVSSYSLGSDTLSSSSASSSTTLSTLVTEVYEKYRTFTKLAKKAGKTNEEAALIQEVRSSAKAAGKGDAEVYRDQRRAALDLPTTNTPKHKAKHLESKVIELTETVVHLSGAVITLLEEIKHRDEAMASSLAHLTTAIGSTHTLLLQERDYCPNWEGLQQTLHAEFLATGEHLGSLEHSAAHQLASSAEIVHTLRLLLDYVVPTAPPPPIQRQLTPVPRAMQQEEKTPPLPSFLAQVGSDLDAAASVLAVATGHCSYASSRTQWFHDNTTWDAFCDNWTLVKEGSSTPTPPNHLNTPLLIHKAFYSWMNKIGTSRAHRTLEDNWVIYRQMHLPMHTRAGAVNEERKRQRI